MLFSANFVNIYIIAQLWFASDSVSVVIYDKKNNNICYCIPCPAQMNCGAAFEKATVPVL